jgi:type I restriction enzyme, S subunit
MKNGRRSITTTGGRDATTRHIPGDNGLAVGMPTTAPPAEWTWTLLTDLARLESGHTPSRRHPEYWQGNIPWISLTDARPNHGKTIADTAEHTNELGIANSSARVLPKHTICLSRTASVGYVVVMGCEMATSQDFVNWVCSEKLDHNFLKYLLLSESRAFRRFSSGAVHQTIYFPEVKAFHICRPPIREQRRIVGILDRAFAGIATAKATAEKNLQNARDIFESHLQSVFTKRGKGWVEKPLGEVCEVKDGTHDSPKYVAGGIPFVTQKNIREDGLSFEKTKFISQEDHDDFYRRSNVAYEDVLISMIGANRGMACIVDDEQTFSIKNIGLVKKNPSINQQFLLYFLKSPQAASYVQAASKGGAQEFIGLTELRRFPVPLPSLERQNTLAETFQSLRAETQRLAALYQRKLAALDELKKSLLHQAFTGAL